MKPREIRKVVAKPKLVTGWLAVDGNPGDGGNPIAFFVTPKPFKEQDGCWRSRWGHFGSWDKREWKAVYGKAPLPKPGACERVRLEL